MNHVFLMHFPVNYRVTVMFSTLKQGPLLNRGPCAMGNYPRDC